MSVTDEHRQRSARSAEETGEPTPVRHRRSGCCWSGTPPTSTWASGPSWAAGPPRRTDRVSTRWDGGCSRGPPNCRPTALPTSPWSSFEPEATVFTNIAPAAPTSSARGSRRCATSDSRSSPNPRSTKTVTSTATCSTTSRYAAARVWPACSWPRPTVRRSGYPSRTSPATASRCRVLGFREHASWALASDTLEFVDLEDIPGVFREPLPRIGLDSLPEQGAWLQPFRPLSSLLTSRV